MIKKSITPGVTALLLASSSLAHGATAKEISDRVGEILLAKRVEVRAVGLLSFCEMEGLKKAVVDKIGRDVVSEAVASKQEAAMFEAVVGVHQSIETYSNGMVMGLRMAQLSAQKRSEICASTLRLADQVLGGKAASSEP